MAEVKRIEARVTYTAMAIEASLGSVSANPLYRILDLNSYSDAATSTESTTREVMSQGRQALKGSQTGKTTTFGYNIDNTIDNTVAQVATFLFNIPKEQPTSRSVLATSHDEGAVITGVTATTVTSAPNAFASFSVGSLIVLADGTNDRTLLKVTEVSAEKDVLTFVPVYDDSAVSTVNEPTRTARVVTVGYAQADTASIVGFADRVELTLSTAIAGIQAGEWLYVGDAVSASVGFTPFYGRVVKVNGTTLTFDTTTAPVSTQAYTFADGVNVFVGTFIVNGDEAVSTQMVRYLGEDSDGKTMLETFTGCMANEMSINASEKSLLKMDMSYMCLDSEAEAVDAATYKSTIVDNTVPAPENEGINLSTDIVRQRLAIPKVNQMNTAAIHSFVQEANVSITNNLSEDTAMGHLGSVGTSAGTFAVTGTITAFFNSLDAIKAIKCNCTVGMDTIYARKNAGLVIDVPATTLASGGLTIERGQSIKIPLEQTAFKSEFGFTVGYTVFNYLPSTAMPYEGCAC